MKVDTQGFRLSAQSSQGMQLETVAVPAQRYVVAIEELFKGEPREHLEVVAPVIEGHQWIVDDLNPAGVHYFDTTVFQGALTGQLDERGLFIVQQRAADGLQVLKQVWHVEQIGSGLDALRVYASGDAKTIEQAIARLLAKEHQRIEAHEALINQKRAELNKTLMRSDLDLRRTELLAYIEALGFKGLWSYDAFVAREQKRLEALGHSDQRIPSRPEDPMESLWHDASQEVERINLIFAAREQVANSTESP